MNFRLFQFARPSHALYPELLADDRTVRTDGRDRTYRRTIVLGDDRRGRHRHRPGRRFDFDPAQLRMSRKVSDRVHMAVRDLRLAQPTGKRLDSDGCEHRIEGRVQLFAISNATLVAEKTRIRRQRRERKSNRAEGAPFALVLNGEYDTLATGEFECTVGSYRGMADAHPCGCAATVIMVEQRHRHPVRQSVEE